MNDFIDIYCERTQAGLWDEPLNALSNAAFIIAAFFALKTAGKRNVLNPQTGTLISLLAIIGVGSFLFHTFANTWSKFADVIPILLFQLGFIAIYARNIIGFGALKIGGLLALFFASSIMSGMFPYSWLNGSIGYAPALFFLIGFGIYHKRTHKTEPNIYLITAAIFALSLTFRSIDMAVCEALPIGVHYMWHILNGVTLYLTLRGLILNWPPPHRHKNTSPAL